jgi:hypothetical protein
VRLFDASVDPSDARRAEGKGIVCVRRHHPAEPHQDADSPSRGGVQRLAGVAPPDLLAQLLRRIVLAKVDA